MIVLIFVSSNIGIFFIRETKDEKFLFNIYSDIFPDYYNQLSKNNNNDNKVKYEKNDVALGQDISSGGTIFQDILKDLKSSH